MKKRILATMMASVLGISLLAGCGGNSTATTETEKDESTTTSEVSNGSDSAITGSDQNTLTVWAWDKAFNIYAMEEAEKIYQKENPDFKLNIVETSWDDLQTTLGTILASGDYTQLPDIMLMQDFAFQKYVITYPDLFSDITDSGIKFDEFATGKLGASVVGGKNYGVPFDNGTEVAAYRTDILEQAGYTVEDLTNIDWDQFITIGKDVLEKTGYSLFSVQSGSADIIFQMMQSAGQSVWNDDNTPNVLGNETLKECISVYQELISTGVMATGNNWDEYIATFTSGKTAGTINGCWILASVQTQEEYAGSWAVTNMPSLPGIKDATNNSNQGGSTWAVTSNSKNKELATDFLAKTFAGSVELYETILPSSGALSTWTPAGESDVYAEPQEFFGGQTVYSLLTEFAGKTPAVNMGVYYTEANDAVATAVTNIVAGSDIDTELKTAQETIEFNMGN